MLSILGKDHLIFSWGGWYFFLKKNSYRSEKNQINKKFVLHSLNLFEALFPGIYKVLQITLKLSCMKHVDLLLASSVLNVN